MTRFASGLAVIAWAILTLAAVGHMAGAETPTDPAAQREARWAELLEQMRSLAQATKVRYQQGDRQPQLGRSPVFRYDNLRGDIEVPREHCVESRLLRAARKCFSHLDCLYMDRQEPTPSAMAK